MAFKKGKETFHTGEHVIKHLKPEPLHGTIDSYNSMFLVITLADGPPPPDAKVISRNINVYGYTTDRKQVLLW